MPHRLLLADDSVTIQKVIELTFADEDVTVVAVGDGDAAIAKLSAEAFDVVLADVGMPGKDGYQVAEFLRDRPGRPKVPVLLLTGAFDHADPARVTACGASAVLAKPFEPQVLVTKVRALLAGAAAPSAAASATLAGHAETPLAVEALPAPAAEPKQEKAPSVDDYFERLDRAFANLNVPLEPREQTGPASHLPIPPTPAHETTPNPQPATPQPAAAPSPARSLADRFETMLAVEQGELPASALEPPATGADAELVDRVARRVVERLGDSAVRQLAAEIVSRTAERLVREEIDRIKAGVRN
jgi:DNA-binding response OmpR family regulator